MKNFLLTLACISFVTIIGAAVYEHVAMVPHWTAAPPASLSMFQGDYGLNAGPFWIPVHPVTVLLLIAALIANWKTPRQKNILSVLAIYITILIITFSYFVPELMAIINTPFNSSVNADLQSRGAMWEKLSIVRLFVLIGMAYILLSSLTKPTVKA